MENNIKDLDIHQIFDEVTKSAPREPNSFPLQFELESLKELFEFLLQFVTMLCKEFYGDSNGQVNLGNMNPEQFNIINKYMQSIGFTCNFNSLPANFNNINFYHNNRYDRITINSNTTLNELYFAIKCEHILYVINFEKF